MYIVDCRGMIFQKENGNTIYLFSISQICLYELSSIHQVIWGTWPS